MMRVLFDTDIILDVFLKRAPFVEPAAALWLANEQGQIDGYVSAITPVNLFYVARKLKGVETARRAVVELIDAFRVCPVERTILQDALALPFHDFEDAVQHAAAVASRMDVIVTRDLVDYVGATLPVFSPADFLNQLPAVQ